MPAAVFFAYARRDRRLRNDVEDHLALLKREGLISEWNDRMIAAGQEWKDQIDRHLEEADVILLLVSANFVASDYCYDIEMARAMERHYGGEARVIPVILRPCQWTSAPFGKLQALPTDAKAVTLWSNRDAALLNIADGIRVAVEEMTHGREKVVHPTTETTDSPLPQRRETEDGEEGWFDVVAAAETEGQGLVAVVEEIAELQARMGSGTEARTKEVQNLAESGKASGQAMLLIAAAQAREMNEFATRIDEIVPRYKARWRAYREHTVAAARRLGKPYGPTREQVLELQCVVANTLPPVTELVGALRRLRDSYESLRGIARVLNTAIGRARGTTDRLVDEFNATADDITELRAELSELLDSHKGPE